MKSNHTSRTAARKSFLSFGVLSPQNGVEQQAMTVQPMLEQKVQPRVMFKAWKVRRYET